MKVLQIYKTYTPDTFGGVEQVIKNICSETAKLGVEQHLLTVSHSARRDQVDALPVIRCQRNFEIASCPFSWEFFRQFKQITQGFDLLHFHYPWPFADLTALLHRLKIPSIVTYHADALKSPLLKTLYYPIQQAFLRKVTRIVPTSMPLLKSSPTLQAYAYKSTVIPIGIHPADYPLPDPVLLQHWRERLGTHFALFVGVLRHYKGLSVLLQAAQQVKIPIVIAGGGPLAAELAAWIKTHQLHHVHLLGRVSEADKLALLALSSMVVLPSQNRAEAFGVSLLEGLLFKKPLISTELGTGTTYVNQDGKTGFVVRPGNAQDLAEKINFLAGHPREAVQMGETGQAWFLQEFQANLMGKRYFDLYQALLGK